MSSARGRWGPLDGPVAAVGHAVARLAFVTFGRLPTRVRRAVVRQVGRTFVAGAVGVMERDGQLLLIRSVYRSGWGLPGGMLSRRESPAQAVVREVREELGLEVTAVQPGAVVLDLVPQRLDVVFRLSPGPGADLDGVRPHSAELAEARWFPAGHLPEDLQAEARHALDALRQHERTSPWVVGGRQPQ